MQETFNSYITSSDSFGLSLDVIQNSELHAAVKKQKEEAQASRQADLITALNTVCKKDTLHAGDIADTKKNIKAHQKKLDNHCKQRDRNRVIHALFVSDSEDITPTVRFGCYMVIHDAWQMTQDAADSLNKALGVDSPYVTSGDAGRQEDDRKKRETWENEVFSKAEGLLPEGILKTIRDSQS